MPYILPQILRENLTSLDRGKMWGISYENVGAPPGEIIDIISGILGKVVGDAPHFILKNAHSAPG